MEHISLKTIQETFGLTLLSPEVGHLDIPIYMPDVNRPGLQLADYYMHFGPDRIQVIGNMEYAYLASLSPEVRQDRLKTLFATGIPCLVLARGYEPMPEMLEAAHGYQVPLLGTTDTTGAFMSSLTKFLHVELAEMISIHGVLIEVYGIGVLILGESGVGKSETALELVKRGHRLIADDLVEIRKVSDITLLGRAPEIIRYLIEIRGVGILDIKELYGVSSVKYQENINCIISLEAWDDKKTYQRFSLEEEYTDILGIPIPSVTVPVRPGRNLAIIVEAASINYRQKTLGYNAAKTLAQRVFGAQSDKTEDTEVEDD